MNGEVCCILGICCPPSSAKQRLALAKQIRTDYPMVPQQYAEQAAEWILKNFDLAPAGTLGEFKKAIAKIAREHGDE